MVIRKSGFCDVDDFIQFLIWSGDSPSRRSLPSVVHPCVQSTTRFSCQRPCGTSCIAQLFTTCISALDFLRLRCPVVLTSSGRDQNSVVWVEHVLGSWSLDDQQVSTCPSMCVHLLGSYCPPATRLSLPLVSLAVSRSLHAPCSIVGRRRGSGEDVARLARCSGGTCLGIEAGR